MDWQVIATIASPVIALLVGGAAGRVLERRPRLVSFLLNATTVRVNAPGGDPFNINSHSVVVRNAGRLAATNVRLGHNYLPSDFSVWPSIENSVSRHADGTAEILFPTLVPGEQVTVTYLYYPPAMYTQINSYTKSDSGYARIVTAITAPIQSPWVRGLITGLATYGTIMALYGIWQGFVWLYVHA